MSEKQSKTFEVDGTRPIENTELEIADTFEEDGERPIAESPDFLLSDRQSPDTSNSDSTAVQYTKNNQPANNSRPVDDSESKGVDTVNIDGKRPIDNGDVEVVDTFEADGTRPIMANKYEVVDTLDVDGERPITSDNE